MKVLHVFDHSLPLHSGYSFRSRAILLSQQDIGIETVHLTGPRHTVGKEKIEMADGLRFYRTLGDGTAVGPGIKGLFSEVAATRRRLHEVCDIERPDLIHAHSPVLTGFAALKVGGERGLPVVYEIRATWEDAAVADGRSVEGDVRWRMSRLAETHVSRRADAVAVICDGLKREFLKRGCQDERLFVAPNAVDIDQYQPIIERDEDLACELDLVGKEVVGFAGSFYDYEGLDVLIDAVAMLADRRPHLHVLLLGGGPAEASLRAQVMRLGLEGRIRLLGRVANAEVRRYYSLVDVLAYPRKSCRLTDLVTPLKPLEAMAMGIPLIASDVGGHRELVSDGITGTLCTAGSASSLATALSTLLDDRERMKSFTISGRRYVCQHRTWKQTVLRYRATYERLLGR